MTRILPSYKFLCTVIFFVVALFPALETHGASIEINATVKITVCGDSIVESPEQCDGSNLNGTSCTSLGYTGGSFSCSSACEFVTSQCTSVSPGSSNSVSSGGSVGGGGGGIISTPSTSAIFSGRAYPGSIVTLLKDAQIAATTIAGSNAMFSVNLTGLSGGSYIFSIYSEDKKGVRSSLLTFPVSITSGTTANVTGIFVAPTISIDKSEVRRGDNIAIFGQAAPASEVTISINSEEEFFVKKVADANGAYLLNFDTSVLDFGQHQTKSKASLGGEITAFGKVVGFTVGTKNIVTGITKVAVRGDFNGDGRVNLVDFSIGAFWYKRPNPPVSYDLHIDGKIDLIDFSIMAFHWTG